MFSVRIVTADYYMASPLQGLDICQSPLTQAPVKKVPVVRVFGATPAGKRARGAGGSRRGAGVALPAAHTRARRRPSRWSCGASPSPPPSPLLPCVTRGATMWIGGSAAHRPPPRRGGGGRLVFTLRAAAAAACGTHAPGRGGGSERPRTLEPWPREAGPGGRATSCGNGFPRAPLRGGSPVGPRTPPAPPQLPLPGGGRRGAGKCQLCGRAPCVAASPRRSPRPLPELRAAGERRPGPDPPPHWSDCAARLARV